ncbi:MAG: histidinol dehydrogenase [Methylovirgula sp.]
MQLRLLGFTSPGGTAQLSSSVLMNAVPAKVAGCRAVGHGRAGAGWPDRVAGACRRQARGCR